MTSHSDCCHGNSAIDPVCGMTVTPETAAGSAVHEGQTYYFCSDDCAKAFDKDPAAYCMKK